jgi:hypothetical protein
MSHELKTDIMVDLETLGLKPGSVILSLAAVPFNTYRNTPFYKIISIGSCREAGLVVDDATLAWWDTQPTPTKVEAFSGSASLRDVLIEFSRFLDSVEGKPVLWGNAASFDLKLLEAAYEAAGVKVPWDFRSERCYRTLKNIFPQVTSGPFDGLKHNALADAKFQARHAENIFDYIYKSTPHAL